MRHILIMFGLCRLFSSMIASSTGVVRGCRIEEAACGRGCLVEEKLSRFTGRVHKLKFRYEPPMWLPRQAQSSQTKQARPRQSSTPKARFVAPIMSSSEIPNLKTLLGARRGGHSRGRGRGRGTAGATHQGNDALKDEAVQKTDDDAAGFRLSSVELGYLDDPYAKYFATQSRARRPPLINRGTVQGLG